MIRIDRRLIWRHPEWWAVALSAVAWMLILIEATVSTSAAAEPHHTVAIAHNSGVAASAREWLLMIVAMMVPLSIASIRATADRSLWRRRHLAIAAWLGGYIAICLIFGVALTLFASLNFISSTLQSGIAVSIAFLAAALWQVSPPRARLLIECHRVQPLAPSGWRANYDCARHGWTIGLSCSLTCGLLMFACWLLGHGVLGVSAMVAATAIGLAERYMIRPDQAWLAAPIASIGLFIAATW